MLITYKYKIAVLLACIFSFTACQNSPDEQLEQNLFDHIQVFTTSDIEQEMIRNFSLARNMSDVQYVKQDGNYILDMTDFNIGTHSFKMPNQIQFVKNNINSSRTLLTEFENDMSEVGVSDEFNSQLEELFNIINNLDQKSKEQAENDLLGQLNNLNEAVLDKYERLALDHIINYSLVVIENAVEHEISASGRLLDDCDTNWRNVASAALVGGLATGATYGINGIQQGAIAGLAGGNPVVGGIVGGIAAFTIGFVGGAIATGTAKYIADKVFCEEDEENRTAWSPYICLDQFCNNTQVILPLYQIAITSYKGIGTFYFDPNIGVN